MRGQNAVRFTALRKGLSVVASLFSLLLNSGIYVQPATTAEPHTFVYLSSNNSTSINPYRIGADGSLTPLKPSTIISGGRYPEAVAGETITDQKGEHFYAIVHEYGEKKSTSAILQFKIGNTGQLMPLSPTHIEINSQAASLVMSRNGKLLYVFSSNVAPPQETGVYVQPWGWSKGISVTVYHVAKNGTLHHVPFGTHSFLNNPYNQYAIRDTPVREVTDPTGRFLYMLLSEEDFGEPIRTFLSLMQFRILPSGNLQPLKPFSVDEGFGGQGQFDGQGSLGLDARDRMVFASNGHGTEAYTIMSDGMLMFSPAIFEDKEVNVTVFACDDARHCLFGFGNAYREVLQAPTLLVKYRLGAGGHLIERRVFVISDDGRLSPYVPDNYLIPPAPFPGANQTPSVVTAPITQSYFDGSQLDAVGQRLYCFGSNQNALAFAIDKDGNIAPRASRYDLRIKDPFGVERFLIVTRH